jgi:hypothetical protein
MQAAVIENPSPFGQRPTRSGSTIRSRGCPTAALATISSPPRSPATPQTNCSTSSPHEKDTAPPPSPPRSTPRTVRIPARRRHHRVHPQPHRLQRRDRATRRAQHAPPHSGGHNRRRTSSSAISTGGDTTTRYPHRLPDQPMSDQPTPAAEKLRLTCRRSFHEVTLHLQRADSAFHEGASLLSLTHASFGCTAAHSAQ